MVPPSFDFCLANSKRGEPLGDPRARALRPGTNPAHCSALGSASCDETPARLA
jgi:hypothetical protein